MEINKNFIEEINKAFKNEEDLDNFLNNCQIPLKKSIKINTNKISVEKFKEISSKYGWHLTSSGLVPENKEEDIFYVDRDNTEVPLGNTFFHKSGFIYVQEIAAGLASKFLDLKENDLVLDMSASPGGKSAQIGDYLLSQNKERPGFLVSNDISQGKVSTLAHNINRMGVYNGGITRINGFSFGKNLGEIFDHVLIDAPCSGEGTGFKSNFSLKFRRKEEIKKRAGTQFQLLISAIKSTKPGGTIIFSTCTLNHIENEDNIKKLLEFFGNSIEIENINIPNKGEGFENWGEEELLSKENAQKLSRLWPHMHRTGGFFIAKIRKKESTSEDYYNNKLIPKNPFKLEYSQALQNEMKDFVKNLFGISIDPDSYLFISSTNQVYITSHKFKEIKDLLNFEKVGLPIAKKSSFGELRPTHHLGCIWGEYAKNNFVEVDYETAQKYSSGQNLSFEEVADYKTNNKTKYLIIRFNGYGIGIGKIVDGVIKNKYIKS